MVRIDHLHFDNEEPILYLNHNQSIKFNEERIHLHFNE
jgi:hypothetical protein